jgi:hypothetical protein
MKLEFFRQATQESPNIKFHENPTSGSRRTETHDEANSRLAHFAQGA